MLTVLVVDDDLDLLEMVGFVLRHNNINTYTVSEAQLFLPTVKRVRPQLILMDVFLRNADGRTLCRNIKSMEEYKELPVILYSAGVLTEESIKQSLADDFLKKPFENGELIEKIHSLAVK